MSTTPEERRERKLRKPRVEPRIFREERERAYQLGLRRGLVIGLETGLRLALEDEEHGRPEA